MSKDPALLFYPVDFLHGTHFFSHEQVGAYIRLLCWQADAGHLSLGDIKKIIGDAIWESIWEAICCKFKQDEHGLYFNERLDKEKEKRQKFTLSRQNNLKTSHMGVHMNKHMDKHMDAHMENRNEDENTSSLSSSFSSSDIINSNTKPRQKKERVVADPALSRQISDLFLKGYKHYKQADYIFAGAKDGKALKALAAMNLPIERYIEAIDNGFKDQFHFKNMDLVWLAACFNKLQGAQPQKPKTQEQIIADAI